MPLSRFSRARGGRALLAVLLCAGMVAALLPVPRAAAATLAATTMSLTSTPDTDAHTGDPVTFDVTVAGAAGGTPTGTVSFHDTLTTPPTDLGSSPVDGAGHAALTISTLTPGTHAVEADYGGDSSFSGTGLTIGIRVRYPTSLTLTAAPSSPGMGDPVSLTATVTTTDGGAVTDGRVAFTEFLSRFAYAYLDAGSPATAVLMTAQLIGGTHHLTATFEGDARHEPSSGTADLTVAPASTTTTVSSTRNPSETNGPVMLLANVAPVPSPTVLLSVSSDPGDPVGMGQSATYTRTDSTVTRGGVVIVVTRGQESWGFAVSTPNLRVGTYTEGTGASPSDPTLTVSDNNRSCSPTSGSFTVAGADWDTGGQLRGLDATFQQQCGSTTGVLRGHLRVALAPPPWGDVTFYDGSTSLGTAIVVQAGNAVTAGLTTALTTGAHSITAVFAGTSTYSASTAPAMTQNVEVPAATVSLQSSTNPSISMSPLTLDATLMTTAGGPAPTGTVTFMQDGTALGTGQVVDDGTGRYTARLNDVTFGTGTYSLTAAYAGDTVYAGATSPPVTQSVARNAPVFNLGPFSVTPEGDPNMSIGAFVGTSGSGPPTGTVDFYDGGVLLQAGVPIVSTFATLKTGMLAAGDHNIRAVYSGDGNYTGATASATLPVRVRTRVILQSFTNPTVPSQRANFLATLDWPYPNGAQSMPTGWITFLDGPTQLAMVPVDDKGRAALTTSQLTTGTHNITAMYSGDGSFTGSQVLGGEGILTQTVQAATPNRRFVNQLYNDVLYRTGGGAAATWATLLDQHSIDRTQLALTLVGSVEYITQTIQDTYNAHLGRDADPQGLGYWLNYIQKGATYEQLDVSFLGTVEYFRNAGGTDDLYLDALYAEVFGRTIDDGGRTFWDGRLAAGTPLWQVAMSVVMSNEAMSNRVTDMYLWYLGRKPDAGGLAHWVGLLQHGTRDETLAAFLAGSDEYWKDTQGS